MERKSLDRLVKFIGLAGSDNAGEAENSRKKAVEMILEEKDKDPGFSKSHLSPHVYSNDVLDSVWQEAMRSYVPKPKPKSNDPFVDFVVEGYTGFSRPGKSDWRRPYQNTYAGNRFDQAYADYKHGSTSGQWNEQTSSRWRDGSSSRYRTIEDAASALSRGDISFAQFSQWMLKHGNFSAEELKQSMGTVTLGREEVLPSTLTDVQIDVLMKAMEKKKSDKIELIASSVADLICRGAWDSAERKMMEAKQIYNSKPDHPDYARLATERDSRKMVRR